MSIAKRMTICLLMIVKNETHIIKETLDSIKKYIDYWVICDTGSTDGTQEMIKKYFEDANIKGELFQHEWRDFGHNRTLAFNCAYNSKNKSDYVWVIDADDLVNIPLNGDFNFPKKMTCDSYLLKYDEGNISYYRTQIFKNTIKWKYSGVLHEYAEPVDKRMNIVSEKINGNYSIISRRLGSRSKDPEKYKKDANILIKAIEKNEDPALKPRYYFYTGQSFKDCGDYENSLKYYKLRIECGGWFEEIFCSWCEIGFLMEIINSKIPNTHTSQEIIDAYTNSYKTAPHRAEGLFRLEHIMRVSVIIKVHTIHSN